MTNKMTATGFDNLQKQLATIDQQLKSVAERIKEARDLGDLSENAEYHSAKEEQAFLMGRRAEVEQKVKTAQVVKAQSFNVVAVGCSVEVENGASRLSFHIVGSDESDPLKGKISADSPIGSALCGHKPGETVEVKTPAGKSQFRILKIGQLQL